MRQTPPVDKVTGSKKFASRGLLFWTMVQMFEQLSLPFRYFMPLHSHAEGTSKSIAFKKPWSRLIIYSFQSHLANQAAYLQLSIHISALQKLNCLKCIGNPSFSLSKGFIISLLFSTNNQNNYTSSKFNMTRMINRNANRVCQLNRLPQSCCAELLRILRRSCVFFDLCLKLSAIFGSCNVLPNYLCHKKRSRGTYGIH